MTTIYRIRHVPTGAWLCKKTGEFDIREKMANVYYTENGATQLRNKLKIIWLHPRWHEIQPGDLEIVESVITHVRTF